VSVTSFQLPPMASCSIVMVTLSFCSRFASFCITGARMSRKYRFLSQRSAKAPQRSCCVTWASKTHHVRSSAVTSGSHSSTVPMQLWLSIARAKGNRSTSASSNSWMLHWLFAKASHQYVTEAAACKCRDLACSCSIRTVSGKGVPHQCETIHVGGCLPCERSSANEHWLCRVSGRTKKSRTSYMLRVSSSTLPPEPSTMSYFSKHSSMNACSSSTCCRVTLRIAVSGMAVLVECRAP